MENALALAVGEDGAEIAGETYIGDGVGIDTSLVYFDALVLS